MHTIIAFLLFVLVSPASGNLLPERAKGFGPVPRLLSDAPTLEQVGPTEPDHLFGWQSQGTFPNTVFTDLSFCDDSVGFASAELGVVYRTTNSGQTWTRVMNLGFPYYWYGVHVLSRQDVLVTGFNNSAGTGIYRWSSDGGTTWDSIVTLDTANWFSRVKFADSLHGIILAGWNGGIWRTENGGRNPVDWSYVQVDPSRGWFEGSFTFRPDHHCYITGISFCHSSDAGASWDVQHSADPVFDGGVSFPDSLNGWTGGGQISAPVSGWVHRTTDGGQIWSDRLTETPGPVRCLLFLNDTLGFIAGGNLYSQVGFIYSTTDAGDSWTMDVNTGSEMKGIGWAWAGPDSVDIWCAGFNSSFTGCVYRTRIGFGTSGVGQAGGCTRHGSRISPNPARGWLDLELGVRQKQDYRLLDASGRTRLSGSARGLSRLNVASLPAGWYLLEAGRAAQPVVITR